MTFKWKQHVSIDRYYWINLLLQKDNLTYDERVLGEEFILNCEEQYGWNK